MLASGQNIQIEPMIEMQHDNKQFVCNTEVIKYNETEQRFTIRKPEHDTDVFTKAERLMVTVIEEDGEVYQFETTVLDGDDSSEEGVMCLAIPEQIKRVQRRAFIRVDIHVPVRISLDPEVEAVTHDLSGGGMSMQLPLDVAIDVDQELQTTIALQDDQPIQATCRIVRLESKEETNKQNVYVTFTDIDEADRRAIVYYCFQKQVEEYRNQR